ncbi:hypothetical protein Moror_11335 [Moniliophthora roreri MCA 2997]|uniref:F-box domain-containing protein n=1 Tax=Moniliophthora roreri (strain MCA 2997) TaxID=1381753 RepID=V2WXN0_MONRO|nr:hypothetical protein Moror_11335 [Moniliophthora roreri MCA 2997]
MSTQNPRNSIFSLPTELVEHIVVVCALLESPSSIASLSRTCRYFRDLVYDSSDNHLWREIYLTTFDDPRPVLKALKTPVPEEELLDDKFDWRTQYQDRVRAVRLFQGDGSASLEPAYLEQSFNALLSSITTSPLHSPTDDQFEVGSTSTSRRDACIPPSLNLETESSNASWISHLLADGYPDALMHRLIGRPLEEPDKNERIIRHAQWENTKAGRAFHHLLLQTGFQARPSDGGEEEEDSDQSENEHHYNLRSTSRRKHQDSNEEEFPSSPSAAKQRSLARVLARHRVYNLRYLSADRCWGPYLPFGKFTKPAVSSDANTFIRHVISNLSDAFFTGHSLILAAGDEDEDEVDGDYDPEDDDDDDTESNSHLIEGVVIETASEDEDESGASSLEVQVPPELDVPIYPAQPHLLRPDYAFLSAARMVVEENLRERYGHKFDHEPLWPWFTSMEALDSTRVILERARNLDGLRMGGAPGFWNADGVKSEHGWVKPEPVPEGEEEENQPKVNGCSKEQGEVDGWDWAGAAGKWMRAVSWMDYRDLLFHNLSAYDISHSRLNPDIQETIRVFPMQIRVTGYSRVPPPPALPPPEAPGSPSAASSSRSPQVSYARAPPSTSSASAQGLMSPISTTATDGDTTTMLAELANNRASKSDTKGKGKAKAESDVDLDSDSDESLADLMLGLEDSQPAYDPLVYALPIIHVAGEYVGSDVDEHAQRRCRGTVRMIGDRAVRWTLITSDASSPDHDEWVMEGIQVGGIGSMMGVVGMWTGAAHESGDPIGPSWAWKME